MKIKTYLKPFKIILAAVAMCSTVMMSSCSEGVEGPKEDGGQEVTPVGQQTLVILDTDIGSSTDDLFALEMLHRYHDEGRCRLLGVVVDREGEDYAACTDVMNTYFGHGDLPIGLERDGIKNPRVFTDYRNLRNVNDNGRTLFAHTIEDYSALPDGWKLYRQLLASQPDGSVSICSVGFVTCLAHLLESKPDDLSPLTGVELVRKKVKALYLMAGVFTSSEEPDYNLVHGISYAQTLFNLWPADVDVLFSPMEVGNGIAYTQEQVLRDLASFERHPIKYVYENIYKEGGGQKMWDPLTILQAIEGDALFTLSTRGTVKVTDEGKTDFTPSPTGNCRYQMAGSSEWNEAMLNRIRAFGKQR